MPNNFAKEVERWRKILQEDMRKARKAKPIEQITLAHYVAGIKSDLPMFRPKLAHSTIYDAILKFGYEEISHETDPWLAKVYNIPQGEKLLRYKLWAGALPQIGEIVGLDPELNRLMAYFYDAQLHPRRSEMRKQALLLISATGTGKDVILDGLQIALESYGPIWVIKNCPYLDEPLHLLRRHIREEAEMIELFEQRGIIIEGDICQLCKARLQQGWPEENLEPYQIEDFPVISVEYSIRSATGISEIDVTDETNFGRETLIGNAADLQLLHKGESETDPRVANWKKGAIVRGSRGTVQWHEISRNPDQAFNIIVTAIQDKRVPSPIGGSNYWDGVHIGTSNWPRYLLLARNEHALMRRFYPVELRYNRILNLEIRRARQDLADVFKPKGQHTEEPQAIQVAAELVVMSRYWEWEKDKEFPGPEGYYTRMRIRNGENVPRPGAGISTELYYSVTDAAHEKDGTFEALTMREIRKYCFAQSFYWLHIHGYTSLLPEDIIRQFPYFIDQTASQMNFDKNYTARLHQLAKEIETQYWQRVQNEIRPILIMRFSSYIQKLFEEYIERCSIWKNGLSKLTAAEQAANEQRLEELEGNKIQHRSAFRTATLKTVEEKRRLGRPLIYGEFHTDLKSHLELFVFNKLRELGKAQEIINPLDREAALKDIQALGYSPEGARRILNSIIKKFG